MRSPTRREFTDEFKRQAVALWETSWRMQTEVARDLGIQPSLLRRWQVRVRAGSATPSPTAGTPPPTAAGVTMPSPADQASEIARLRRELDCTRMEHDVLKNHLGWGPPVGEETVGVYPGRGRERPAAFWWHVTPSKNMVHGLLRA